MNTQEAVLATINLAYRRSREYARRRRRPWLGEDLAQEVILAAMERDRDGLATQYNESRGKPTTWMSAVLRSALPYAFEEMAYPVRVPGWVSNRKLRDGIVKSSAERVQGAMASGEDVDRIPARESPYAAIDNADELQQCMRLIDRLPPRRRACLLAWCGLDGRGKRTVAEIGSEFGISREWVRREINAGIKIIRVQLGVNADDGRDRD